QLAVGPPVHHRAQRAPRPATRHRLTPALAARRPAPPTHALTTRPPRPTTSTQARFGTTPAGTLRPTPTPTTYDSPTRSVDRGLAPAWRGRNQHPPPAAHIARLAASMTGRSGPM